MDSRRSPWHAHYTTRSWKPEASPHWDGSIFVQETLRRSYPVLKRPWRSTRDFTPSRPLRRSCHLHTFSDAPFPALSHGPGEDVSRLAAVGRSAQHTYRGRCCGRDVRPRTITGALPIAAVHELWRDRGMGSSLPLCGPGHRHTEEI